MARVIRMFVKRYISVLATMRFDMTNANAPGRCSMLFAALAGNSYNNITQDEFA